MLVTSIGRLQGCNGLQEALKEPFRKVLAHVRTLDAFQWAMHWPSCSLTWQRKLDVGCDQVCNLRSSWPTKTAVPKSAGVLTTRLTSYRLLWWANRCISCNPDHTKAKHDLPCKTAALRCLAHRIVNPSGSFICWGLSGCWQAGKI